MVMRVTTVIKVFTKRTTHCNTYVSNQKRDTHILACEQVWEEGGGEGVGEEEEEEGGATSVSGNSAHSCWCPGWICVVRVCVCLYVTFLMISVCIGYVRGGCESLRVGGLRSSRSSFVR
jgi:hypothetical protein